MRRRMIVSAGVLAFVLVMTGCGGGESKQGAGCTSISTKAGGGASNEPVTLTFWSNYSPGREFDIYNGVLKDFTKQYPWITVQHCAKGEDQDPIIAAISAGTPPDAVLFFGPDNVAKLCQSGFQDLASFIQRDNVDLSAIPDAALRYTSYQGVQCALPSLSDAYGLYYNRDLLAAKGFKKPPRTISELTAMAKKLTVFNADGSIQVAGFIPWMAFYENQTINWGLAFGAKWYDDQGNPAIGTDPAWTKLLEWQKSFVDFYGVRNLQQFVAKYGGDNEWNASQAFETGKLAMNLDGEWRVAFIQGDKSTVNYGTAPFPVADDLIGNYGAGQIGGDTVGIPVGSAHPDEAWLLIKYLATDTGALVKLSNGLGNVPTTIPSLQSPDVTLDPHFAPFLDIFVHPKSDFYPLTPVGEYDQDTLSAMIQKWQAGNIDDLQAALDQVDQKIKNQLALGGGP